MHQRILLAIIYIFWGNHAQAVARFNEVFSWSELDWDIPLAMKQDEQYVPRNGLPVGIERWNDKLFVSVPRWRDGEWRMRKKKEKSDNKCALVTVSSDRSIAFFIFKYLCFIRKLNKNEHILLNPYRNPGHTQLYRSQSQSQRFWSSVDTISIVSQQCCR